MLKARRILDTRKKQIEDNLLGLVAQVKDAIQKSAVCLSGGEEALCRIVIERDSQVNERRRLIEHDCFTVIALHQPVSHDLREIIAATRIAGELERIGDYASDNASIVTQMNGADVTELGIENVLEMSSLSTRMLDEVFAAYLQRDTDKARKTAKMDDEIDAEQAKLIEKLFARMQSTPDQVPDASRMLWISHNLERCGDRVTNIAEQVVFMLEAEVVELD
jgi:phosphate transport system protein